MAKEWYLMKTNHDMVSGFEKDDFDSFAVDSFEEALQSPLGSYIEVCNYDLSQREPKKVIIQGNVQDTKLNSLSRTMLAPIGTCIAGQYIFYKNRYWLIVGLVDNNGIYEKAVLSLCNYLLTWVNDKKEIIQRWANITSASQYNNGESNTQYYSTRSNQFLVLTPDDKESLMLDNGARFIIDKRCQIYEKNIDNSKSCDTSNAVAVYQLTRTDTVLYDYQDSGHCEFITHQDEQHKDDGYYNINGKGYWLCEKPYLENKTSILSAKIDCDSLEIYNGLEPCVFTARFYDTSGKEVEVTPQWNIKCDFLNQLDIEYVDNSIYISVDNKNLINKSFELSLNTDGYETTSITVTIRAFI